MIPYHNDTYIRSESADPEYASNCEIFLRTTLYKNYSTTEILDSSLIGHFWICRIVEKFLNIINESF